MTVFDINLIASRRRQKQRAVAAMRLAVYSLIALFVGVGTLYLWMLVATRLTGGEISEVDARLSDPVLADKMARVQFLESGIAGLQPRVDLLEKVHNSEASWIRILRDISACIPSGVWITHFSSQRVDKEQTLSIKGKAVKQADIGQFMLALDGPAWSGAPRLGYTQANPSGGGGTVIDFEITVPLNKIIGSDIK